MKKYIDLTLPIVPHWRCPIEIKEVKSFEKGDAANVTWFTLQTHWYTHIDAPVHQFPGTKTLNDFPLDYLFGKATILDVSHVEANQPITADMLKEALGDTEPTKILLVKTCWEDRTEWHSHDYWDEAPYITEDGAEWLASLEPHVVGFDFPQDYDIRKLRFGVPESQRYLTTHRKILKKDIMMIEYMSNMKSVKGKVVDFVGLPTALENANGAQIRCVAIEDAEEV